MKNLLARVPADLPEELLETLVESEAVRIERIVSRGHVTPEGEWYEQERHEFVLLVQGLARVTFEDGREVTLFPGDWLDIGARKRHRVSWTAPGQDTIWLAVHYL